MSPGGTRPSAMNDLSTAYRNDPHAGELDVADRLDRLHGAVELYAALLALVLPPGSERAVQSWTRECSTTADAHALRTQIASLSAASRLPWFDRLLTRMAKHSVDTRKALLQATRRVMSARGFARPIDRLHWLAMRRALNGSLPLDTRLDGNTDVTFWLESDVIAIADYTAFLARMVPAASEDDDTDDEGAGARWYDQVVANWTQHGTNPAWRPPSSDTMVAALKRLQLMSWMRRPVVIGLWVSLAQKHTYNGRLSDLSADALRLSCFLLDSPLPPELARQYITLDA